MSDMYIIEEEDMSIELDDEEVAMDMEPVAVDVVIWDISILVSYIGESRKSQKDGGQEMRIG